MEPATPEKADMFVRLPWNTHRRCKAVASLDQKDLRGWIAEVLEAELARRGWKEPACVEK